MVKNITLSADEKLIEDARAFMRSRNRTLNDGFREWLTTLSAESKSSDFRDLMERTRHIDLGGPYTRDEMHER